MFPLEKNQKTCQKQSYLSGLIKHTDLRKSQNSSCEKHGLWHACFFSYFAKFEGFKFAHWMAQNQPVAPRKTFGDTQVKKFEQVKNFA